MLCLSDGEYLDREQLLCGFTQAGESLDISMPEGVGLMEAEDKNGCHHTGGKISHPDN